MIDKRNGKWVVLDSKGNLKGEHDLKKDAVKQLQAIELSKLRKEGKL